MTQVHAEAPCAEAQSFQGTTRSCWTPPSPPRNASSRPQISLCRSSSRYRSREPTVNCAWLLYLSISSSSDRLFSERLEIVMTEPITAQIILGAALAITLGLLVRALRVRRAPTPRSVIRAEGKRIVRICKQAARESSVLTPDVLERIELAGERDETGALREAGRS